MKLVLRIVIFAIILSCEHVDATNINFEVTPNFTSSTECKDVEFVSYKFYISTLDTLRLVIDWKSFSYDCYYKEEDDLISRCNRNLACILDSIKFNEFIIENEQGEMDFLVNPKPVEGKIYPLLDVNCMEDWFETYEILPRQSIAIKTPSIIFDYLGVRKKGKRIRFHYLFKPNPDQRQQGYEKLILSSDWFSHE